LKLFCAESELIEKDVQNWDAQQALRIHLFGKPGSGKRVLLQYIRYTTLADYPTLFETDLQFFKITSREQTLGFIHQIIENKASHFKQYLLNYPLSIRRSINFLLNNARHALVSESWILHFFYDFLKFLTKQQPHIIVIEQYADFESHLTPEMLKFLDWLNRLPLIIITTGSVPLTRYEALTTDLQIKMIHRNVREVEKLVNVQLNTDSVSTRLITNQLLIKSGGNIPKIKVMLEAYYRPFLQAKGKKYSIPNDILQQMRISPDIKEIFAALLTQLTEKEKHILGLLSHLKDAIDANIFSDFVKAIGVEAEVVERWLAGGLINEIYHCGKAYVIIGWDKWQQFLQRHIVLQDLEPTMQKLANLVTQQKQPSPLELSGLLAQIGKFDMAVQLALSEARLFAKNGDLLRALGRYAFVKRHLYKFPEFSVILKDFLAELGALQLKIGLNENAFETYRELRESLGGEEKEPWMWASLQMANALIQMDLTTEAHYLIKDIKFRKDVPVYLQAYSHVLNGEIEQYAGRIEYALNSYNQARELIPQIQDEAIVLQLFELLKSRFSTIEQPNEILPLYVKVAEAVSHTSPTYSVMQLELIKSCIQQQDYQKGYELCIKMLRRHQRYLTPRLVVQLHLYLSDIYGYLGKWQLALNHLNRLLAHPLLVPTPRIHSQVLTQRGIVHKELCYYHFAIEDLEAALSIARRMNLAYQECLIKLHLGHTYLLTSNFIRAFDFLKEAQRWAEIYQEVELQFSAVLFLTSYYLQQDQTDVAGSMLSKAEALVSLQHNPTDYLNYSYYNALYLLKTQNLAAAEEVIKRLEEKAAGNTKFKLSAKYLQARLYLQKGNAETAEKLLTELLDNLPEKWYSLEIQVRKLLIETASKLNNHESREQRKQQARDVFQNMLQIVGDKILQKQMEESREFQFLRGN
jgi:hypothetical protein